MIRALTIVALVVLLLSGCGGERDKGANVIKKDKHKDESKERPGPTR